MTNVCKLATGGIIALVAFLILFLNNSIFSKNQNLINIVDKEVMDCYNNERFNKARDGDLIYISGEIDTKEGAYDRDFNIKFREPIIKRWVQRYQRTGFFRNNKESNDLKNLKKNSNFMKPNSTNYLNSSKISQINNDTKINSTINFNIPKKINDTKGKIVKQKNRKIIKQ